MQILARPIKHLVKRHGYALGDVLARRTLGLLLAVLQSEAPVLSLLVVQYARG